MQRQAEAVLPTQWGIFQMMAYSTSPQEPMPHIALVHEDLDISKPVLVRIHSECLTGDLFGSRRCDCGEQLIQALEMISEQAGVLLYLRQEGRGIGLINKLKAYNLQDSGFNTLDANTHLGLEVDARQYDDAIAILQDLQIRSVRLLTNNPVKLEAVKKSSIEVVSREPLIIPPHSENKNYLKAKQELMGHLF